MTNLIKHSEAKELVNNTNKNNNNNVLYYEYYSSFRMFKKCKSWYQIPTDINYFIQLKTNTDEYIEYFKILDEKEYDLYYNILLKDLKTNKYLIFDEATDDDNANPLTKHLNKIVNDYLRSIKEMYELCFMEMKITLLTKLNIYNIIPFRDNFIIYYQNSIKNTSYINKYSARFMKMLDDIIIMNNYETEYVSLQEYIELNDSYNVLFDEILESYCLTNSVNLKVDSYYIIQTLVNIYI
jgi:hypothetical protein